MNPQRVMRTLPIQILPPRARPDSEDEVGCRPVKRLIVASLIVAALLVFPSAMSASIVIDGCIGRIGLWDHSTTVLREWGRPIRTEKVGSDPSFTVWHYKKGLVLLAPWGKYRIVSAIETTDPQERTPAGIGVGSTHSEVVAAYGGRTCRRDLHWCKIGNRHDLARSTALHLKRGRVATVRISLYSNYADVGPQAPDPRCRRSK